MKVVHTFLTVLCLGILFCSCKNEKKENHHFSKVDIKILMQDSLLNVRALEVGKAGTGVFATSDGRFGTFNTVNDKIGVAYQIKLDTIVPNFRSMAITSNGTFLLSIASPSLLYRTDMDTDSLVYFEKHPKAFYDSMDFWNDKEGIAIGDPTEDCMSIIITRDGGNTWTKLPCDVLPKTKEGEAAFAASDTNIAIVGDHTWVATGGKASRILYSPDKGQSWEVFDTPIVQGKETTGMYSIDFYDDKHGYAIGGDYTKPNDTIANKIRTSDGGKTWEVVANGKSPGYRSCVQYAPNSDATELVAVGFNGIDYSKDAGEFWTHLSDEGFYTLRFVNDSVAYAAGRGRIAKLNFR